MRPRRGFTLVEFVIVMAVITIILSVVLPNSNAILKDSLPLRSQTELNTLKAAVALYWKNNDHRLPPNITTALLESSPQTLERVLQDPFLTDPDNATYGYVFGDDPTFGGYFAVYTQGPRRDTRAPVWDAENQRFTWQGSGQVASNAPAVKR